MTTDYVRFMKIYTNFKICFFEFLNNLCKSDKISCGILGVLVTKYVALTKNKLYVFEKNGDYDNIL